MGIDSFRNSAEKKSFSSTQRHPPKLFYKNWVNDENVWYNQNATVWYWNDGDTNGRVLIRVFEEDWLSPDDHMAWFWPLWQVGNQQELFEVNEVRLFVFTD